MTSSRRTPPPAAPAVPAVPAGGGAAGAGRTGGPPAGGGGDRTGGSPAGGAAAGAWVLDGPLADGRLVTVRPVDSGPDGAAFVTVAGGVPVASARYRRRDGGTAAVAYEVDAAYEALGAGELVLEAVTSHARSRHVDRLVARRLAADDPLRRWLGDCGLSVVERPDGTGSTVEVDLAPTRAHLAWSDRREAAARAAGVAAVLRPRSVAVIGAGHRPGAVGHEVVRSLLAAGFAGPVYPVNPHLAAVAGTPAYPSVEQVPGPVDLAVVAVPAEGAHRALAEAAAAGARAAVVVTSGFAEAGAAGAAAQAALAATAREAGVRVVGPNCLGAYNTDPAVRLRATFAVDGVPSGRVAIGLQSGAVGVVLSRRARSAGIGISSFVSLGNTMDLSPTDLLCYWEGDRSTAAVALYLESLPHPAELTRTMARVGRHTPVVVLRAGRSAAGARGARSHTAAAATPEVAAGAVLAHCGAVQVDTLDELFDVAGVLADGPLPAGRRVALVGNAGGPLILAADACAAAGLDVPELPPALRDRLRSRLPAGAATGNPVDLTSGGDAATFEAALRDVLADAAVDAVLAVVTPLDALGFTDARSVIERLAAGSEKPVISCVLADEPSADTGGAAADTDGAATGGAPARTNIPAPDRAARALAKACEHAEWRARPPAPLPARDAARGAAGWDRRAEARRVVDAFLAARPAGGWMDVPAAAALATACGLPAVPATAARSPGEAVAVAAGMGFPVALKAAAGDLVHKTDRGGVALGLGSAGAVEEAYEAMARRLGPAMGGGAVQPMTPPGVEMIVGLVVDPAFGPLVMFGAGGVTSELLADRAFAVPPLDPAGVDRLIGSIRSFPLLTGYRGSRPVDLDAVRQVVAAVSAVADHLPEVVELDCNPVVARPDGSAVVDCKIRVSPVADGPGGTLRRLHQV
ncbi:MAG TPA: acetate--CoA ligase family protein [Acidimicrobiales bacterium]|nr:acetate--CoA ligase family protein [Acidimicrobiales bacterium]